MTETDLDRDRDLPENKLYLLMLAAGPAIWMGHLLLTYATASVWCAKVAGPGGPIGSVPAFVAWYSVVALAGIGAVGWSGYRRHRHGSEAVPHDMATAGDRHRFLGFAALLLAGLSAVATLYVWYSASVVDVC